MTTIKRALPVLIVLLLAGCHPPVVDRRYVEEAEIIDAAARDFAADQQRAAQAGERSNYEHEAAECEAPIGDVPEARF